MRPTMKSFIALGLISAAHATGESVPQDEHTHSTDCNQVMCGEFKNSDDCGMMETCCDWTADSGCQAKSAQAPEDSSSTQCGFPNLDQCHENGCMWEEGKCKVVPQNGSSSSCESSLPVTDIALKILKTASSTDNLTTADSLCTGNSDIVACSDTDVILRFQKESSRLIYEGDNWKVVSNGVIVLEAAKGAAATTYKQFVDSVERVFPLKQSIGELDLVDLAAVQTELQANDSAVASVTLPTCTSTFEQALQDFQNLQSDCEAVGDLNFGKPGACADSCAASYEMIDGSCKAKTFEVDETDIAYTQANDDMKAQMRKDQKKTFARSVLKNNIADMVQSSTETLETFTKRKFKQQKKNMRAWFKSAALTAQAKPENAGKKKHAVRKELRMPVSIGANDDDLNSALKQKLRNKFKLNAGQDNEGQDLDVGIVVGPEKLESDEDCPAGSGEYLDIVDDDNCITYDAGLSADGSVDVHVLGSDESYNVGGILIGDKYVPVVKQVMYNTNLGTFHMSCWSGTDWTSKGTAYIAGDEVQCTASRNGFAVTVDTVIGSTVSTGVGDQQCAAGYGCLTDDSVDPLVCLTGDDFGCEPCQNAEANNAVDLSPCVQQICGPGTGYDLSVAFDNTLDPTDETNANCLSCPDGQYNTGNQGQCQDYSTCGPGLSAPQNYNNKTADHTCEDVTEPVFTSLDTVDAIDENSGSNQVIYTPEATDSAGGDVTFSIKQGSDSNIAMSSGNVILTVSPDYETKSSHSFTVVATDESGNAAEKSLTLQINNVDEVPPSITSTTTVAAIEENSGALQPIYTATASDAGDTSDGFTFSLSGTDASDFSIGSATGVVTLTANPDYETKYPYSFKVKATDAAGNSAETSNLVLNILNVDEVAPTITSGSTATSIQENSGPAQVIYTATANDNQDTSAGVIFALSGTDASAFSIDSSTGEVTLTADPNYEDLTDTQKENGLSFTVSATDSIFTVSETVTLDIENVDEVQCVNAQGKAVQFAFTATHDTVCCNSVDLDDVCDDVDTCFINSCNDKQLTDAYALLKDGAGEPCGGSRRAHAHTEVFEVCYTSGCSTTSQIEALQTQFGTCGTE